MVFLDYSYPYILLTSSGTWTQCLLARGFQGRNWLCLDLWDESTSSFLSCHSHLFFSTELLGALIYPSCRHLSACCSHDWAKLSIHLLGYPHRYLGRKHPCGNTFAWSCMQLYPSSRCYQFQGEHSQLRAQLQWGFFFSQVQLLHHRRPLTLHGLVGFS